MKFNLTQKKCALIKERRSENTLPVLDPQLRLHHDQVGGEWKRKPFAAVEGIEASRIQFC